MVTVRSNIQIINIVSPYRPGGLNQAVNTPSGIGVSENSKLWTIKIAELIRKLKQ